MFFFLIYFSGYPVIPIITPKYYYSKVAEDYLEQYNDSSIVGMCLFFIKEMQKQSNHTYSKNSVYVRGLQTNGHDWKLFEVNDLFVKKTNFYKPKSKFQNSTLRPFIWEDAYHMSSVIGLIRFTLSKILKI